jgi:outer membrane protein
MKYAVAVAGLVSLVAATTASAADQKWLFRVGAAQVNPNDSSTDVVGLGLPAGSEVAVGNATGLALNLTYLFTPNMGVEVLGALPITHDIEGDGAIAGAGKIAETKQLPPTVLFVLRGSGGAIHPYVGLGLNYTTFFSEETEGALAGTSLELDDSFGPAFEAGVDYDLNDQWFLNASLWYMNIKTTASVNGIEVADVKINPIAAILGVGLRF